MTDTVGCAGLGLATGAVAGLAAAGAGLAAAGAVDCGAGAAAGRGAVG